MRYLLRPALLILLFLWGCETAEEAPTSEELSYDTLRTVHSADIGAGVNALGLFSTTSHMIALNRPPGPLFSVFSLPAVEPLYTWGVQGEGPEEFSAPVAAASVNVFGDTIQVDDPNRHMVRTFTIGDEAFKLVDERPLPYDGQRGPLNTVTRLDSLTYLATVAPAGDEQSEFLLLNIAEEEARPFGTYPTTDLEGREKYQSYMKRLAANPNGNGFIAVYLTHDRVRLYDDTGTLQSDRADFSHRETEGAYRLSAEGMEQYAYVLAPFAEEEEMFEADTYRPVLEIWDWSGQRAEAYVLDAPIHLFTVSEASGHLYGYSFLKPEEVFVFELP